MIDLDEIKFQVGRVLAESQGYDEEILDTGPLIDKWYQNKKMFIDAFGDECIIPLTEDEINFELSSTDQTLLFEQCLIELTDKNYCRWYPKLKSFLCASETGFFLNKTYDDRKLTKALKEVINDKEALRKVQDIVSKYIQAGKIRGKLYLSVHPLDFLSSSENNNKWTSCHSLDGDYRCGNLSYMVDNCTAVCYLANEKQEQLKQFPLGLLWNSKKWRRLLHFSHYPLNRGRGDIVYLGRPYPFNNFAIDIELKACLFNPRTPVIPITCEPNLDEHYLDLGIATSMRYLTSSHNDFIGYNDLVYSTLYKPTAWMYKFDYDRYTSAQLCNPYTCLESLRITIGESVPCLIAGCNHKLHYGDKIICETCEDKYVSHNQYCEDCGRRIYEDEEIGAWEEGLPICQHCLKGE